MSHIDGLKSCAARLADAYDRIDRQEIAELIVEVRRRVAIVLAEQHTEELKAVPEILGPLIQQVDPFVDLEDLGTLRTLSYLASTLLECPQQLEVHRWLHPNSDTGKLLRAVQGQSGIGIQKAARICNEPSDLLLIDISTLTRAGLLRSVRRPKTRRMQLYLTNHARKLLEKYPDEMI